MDLKIVDEEFTRGAIRMLDMSTELQEIIKLYSDIIQKLMSEGINDVAIDNVLVGKLTKLQIYSNTMVDIIKNILENTSQFLIEIDTADSFLY